MRIVAHRQAHPQKTVTHRSLIDAMVSARAYPDLRSLLESLAQFYGDFKHKAFRCLFGPNMQVLAENTDEFRMSERISEGVAIMMMECSIGYGRPCCITRRCRPRSG